MQFNELFPTSDIFRYFYEIDEDYSMRRFFIIDIFKNGNPELKKNYIVLHIHKNVIYMCRALNKI